MSSANEPVQNDPAPSRPQKQMSKAERRELQEKQRAAKVAKTATGSQPGGPPAKPPHSASPAPASSNPRKGGRGTESPLQRRGSLAAGPSGSSTKPTKDSRVATTEEAHSRGLRIFSHFALQKPVVHVAKGNVHPAIVHLGLMFAEFRICGANARCIATLSVFRRVGSLCRNATVVLIIRRRSYKTTRHHRTIRYRGTL
jgi:translation initiation factor eIF-2B subunit delta